MPSLIVKTPPTQEPITISEAKDHLRVVTNDDDTYINNLIRSARYTLEMTYRRALLTQSLVIGLDYFGQEEWMPTYLYGWPPSMLTWGPTGWMLPLSSVIELVPPVQSITSITYLDPAGNLQTLASANYVLDASSEPGRVVPNLAKIWPVTAPLPNAVRIEILAGVTDPTLLQDNIKEALRLLLGHYYENREQVVIDTRLVALELPLGVEALMAPFNKRWLVR